MNTILEYIDHNRRDLGEHPLFVGLRQGRPARPQRPALLVAMTSMLAEVALVVGGTADEDIAPTRPLAHRLMRLVALAHAATRPAVLHAVGQSGQLLSAYVSKLGECEFVDPGRSLRVVDAWERACERARPRGTAQASPVLDDDLRQQAMNLVDAVFEVVESGCFDVLGRVEPIGSAVGSLCPHHSRGGHGASGIALA